MLVYKEISSFYGDLGKQRDYNALYVCVEPDTATKLKTAAAYL